MEFQPITKTKTKKSRLFISDFSPKETKEEMDKAIQKIEKVIGEDKLETVIEKIDQKDRIRELSFKSDNPPLHGMLKHSYSWMMGALGDGNGEIELELYFSSNNIEDRPLYNQLAQAIKSW